MIFGLVLFKKVLIMSIVWFTLSCATIYGDHVAHLRNWPPIHLGKVDGLRNWPSIHLGKVDASTYFTLLRKSCMWDHQLLQLLYCVHQ